MHVLDTALDSIKTGGGGSYTPPPLPRTSAHCTFAMCPPRVRSSQLASYSLGPAGRAQTSQLNALHLDWGLRGTHEPSQLNARHPAVGCMASAHCTVRAQRPSDASAQRWGQACAAHR